MAGELVLVVSELTELELSDARPEVRAVLQGLPSQCIERVELTADAAALAEQYVAAGVVSPKMRADARHIGIATVHRVDVPASSNFKHIVNLRRVHGYNSIQLREDTRSWRSAAHGSRDIAGMTFEEEKAYIRERLQRSREGEQTAQREHAA